MDEIEEATEDIVKLTQSDASINKQTCKNRFAKLAPVVQRDIVRVGGRLDKSPLPEESKHPAILPPNHHVTKLIIRHYHEK